MQTNLKQKIISNKIGLLSLAAEPQNVSKACKIMDIQGISFWLKTKLIPVI